MFLLPNDVGPPVRQGGGRTRRRRVYKLTVQIPHLLRRSCFRCNSGMELYGHLLSDTPASTSNPREGEAALPPPILGGQNWSNAEYTDADSALPLQLPGDGIWPENEDFMPGGGPWEENGGLTPGQTCAEYDQLMLDDGMLAGNDQLMHGGSFLNSAGDMQDWLDHPDVTDLLMDAESLGMNQPAVDFINSLGMNQADVDSPGMNQPAVDFINSLQAGVDSPGMSQVQVGGYPPAMGYSVPMAPVAGLNQSGASSSGLTQVSAYSPGLTPTNSYPPAMYYLQPPAPAANVQQTVSDNEMIGLAKMVRVAVECGDVSSMWSEEEDQHLLHGLARLANENIATKCFNIANGLPKKTVMDVAYRIRWLEDKKKAAKQARLGPKKSMENATKGKEKGTNGVNKKNNKYHLSNETLKSKSIKDLIRDNDRLMDRIEENLKTGQLENTSEYFYYVKTNMDAIHKKISDVGNRMDILSIDQEAYEEVLLDRSSSAGKDTTTP